MNEIGVEIILILQSIGDWLAYPMSFFSFLGVEWFYLFIAPIFYWCIHPGLGLRVGLLILFSSSLNSILKQIFHAPRPFWIDHNVRAYYPDTSFGIPSGHAQNATVFWGGLALWVKRTWFWIFAIFLMFAIGFSRVWLGLHFPLDTLVGWLLGLFILVGYFYLEKPITSWLNSIAAWQKIGLSFVISMSLILVGALILHNLGDWKLPTEWVTNVRSVIPADDVFDPVSMSGLITSSAAFFGMSAGATWLSTREMFNPKGDVWKQVGKVLVGLVGVAVLYFGLNLIHLVEGTIAEAIYRFLRYATISFWVTGLAPLLFIRLGLANRQSPPPS